MASMSLRSWVALAAAFPLGAVVCSAVVLPVNYDFEAAEGYGLGPWTAGNGWTLSVSLSANIVEHAFSGSQAVSLTGPGWLTFSTEGWAPGFGSTVTWIDFYLKPVFADAASLPSEVNTALAAVTGFVKTGSVGEVYAVDGDGLGGGDWTASGYTVAVLDEQAVSWMRISYRVDYGNKRWDLFINGNLILADLSFADNAASPFTQLRLKGDAEKPAFLDYFYVGSDNPLFADTSGSGLPDSWLLAHGLNPATAQRYGDPDHDGVDNLTEFLLGLSPNAPDSDNDGAFDRRELLWGTNPQVSEAHNLGALPFSDGFETDAVGAFTTGTRLWQVQAGTNAVVEVSNTTNAPEGARALSLTGSDISLERRFADTTHAAIVWLDFHLKATPRPTVPEEIPADVAAVFYFTSDGHLNVLDGGGNGGGQWRTFTAGVSDWNRVSLRMNYGTQRWALWLNGVRIVDNLGFAHSVPYFSGFAMQHRAPQPGALDAFLASHGEPAALDNDGDGLPNTWEVTYGLNPNDPADAAVSSSGDGWTNTEKFQFGVSPVTIHLTALPFVEPFEQLAPGNLVQGAHNWFFFGGSIPQIQSTLAHEGAQALLIPASEDGVRVVNHIDGSAQTVMWTQFSLKAAPFPNNATPALPPESTAGLFFTQDGQLRVYDGPTIGWRTLTTVTVDLAAWHTVTLRHDYTTQRWSVWIDGTQAAENLGFAHSLPRYKQFEVTGGSGVPTLLDSIRVQTTPPLVLDPTVLPEWWRVQHFGTTNVDPAADSDNDGLSNLDEYLQGRLPTIADTAPVASGGYTLYVNKATGSDSLYNGQSAAANQPATGYGPKATLNAALIIAASDGRIIISADETTYIESTIPLTGKNLVLRPHGNVRITGSN
jgi:hypothetical protein